jgi:hypothetical protein
LKPPQAKSKSLFQKYPTWLGSSSSGGIPASKPEALSSKSSPAKKKKKVTCAPEKCVYYSQRVVLNFYLLSRSLIPKPRIRSHEVGIGVLGTGMLDKKLREWGEQMGKRTKGSRW